MKKLKFFYETRLELNSSVIRHSFCLRCIPKKTPCQKIERLTFEIQPMASFSRSKDIFGNNLCAGYIEETHDYFGFKVSGIAVTNSEDIDFAILNPIFKYPTQRTLLSNESIKKLACDDISFSNVVQKVLVYCENLYNKFEYKSGTTTINTTAEAALKQGCGVCQDYAQILIGLCQKNAIPARYVAGFMIGEGVTHAWVEIYASGQWIGIDPTHNRMTDEKYIKLSDGRDAFDCIIDRGIFFGETRQNQEILVHVEEV